MKSTLTLRRYRASSLSRLRERAGVRAFVPAAALALTACAQQAAAGVESGAPGFLWGVWHGFIFPIAWIVSLFSSETAIYAVPNNGGWYDFGYFIGVVFLGVGARKTRVVYKERVIDVKAKRVEELGE